MMDESDKFEKRDGDALTEEEIRAECEAAGFSEEETLRMIHIHEGIDKGVRDGDR